MSEEEIYEQAYDIYITEGRAEANRLVESGCLVNYREWRKEQFSQICDDDTHWAYKELIEFVKQVKSKQR